MTDDQARRVDGLLASYGELLAMTSRLDAEVDGLQANRAADLIEMRRILDAVQASCDRQGDKLTAAIREQSEIFDRKLREQTEAREAKEEKARQDAVASWQFSRTQKLTLLGIGLTPVITLVYLILGVHPS